MERVRRLFEGRTAAYDTDSQAVVIALFTSKFLKRCNATVALRGNVVCLLDSSKLPVLIYWWS